MSPNDGMAVRAGSVLVVVLCAAAALESYSVSRQLAASTPDTYGMQAALGRYAPLFSKLPSGQAIGYITDLEDATQKATVFLGAQYTLAPTLLVPAVAGQPHEWAIGNFHKQQDFAAIGTRYGYVMVEHIANGVVLYRRAAR